VQNRSITFERSNPINIQIDKDPEAAGYTADEDDDGGHGGAGARSGMEVPVPGTPPMPPPWNPPPKDLKRKPEDQGDDAARASDVRLVPEAASSSQSGMKREHEDGGVGSSSPRKPRLTQDAVICSLMCYLREEAEDKYAGEVCSIEQLMTLLDEDIDRLKFRLEELQKLDDFGTFKSIARSEVPQGVRIFDHRWVDTDSKSRLTVKDLKVFGYDSIEDKNCPTPSAISNGVFDWYVAKFRYICKTYDIVAAFPHALESNEHVYMWPPKEWCDKYGVEVGSIVWHMIRSLYGRGPAAGNFRLLHEAIIVTVPGMGFKMLSSEPCMYFSSPSKTMVIHHIDDGRVGGPGPAVDAVTAWIAKYLLLKLSPKIENGMAYKYLNRTRVRLTNGWATIPDPRLMQAVRDIIHMPETCKVAATPSVKRLVEGDETPRTGLGNTDYRSCVGKLIHLSLDVEMIAYAVKELARNLSAPDASSWCAVSRLVRFMTGKEGFATICQVSESAVPDLVDLSVKTDSDWAGSEDCRSSSGVHVEIDGFKTYHSSVTQPGLPALSSAEAETRALSRGGCIGLQIKVLLEECGFKVKYRLICDAQAAIDGTQKLSGSRLRHLEIAQKYAQSLVRGKHARIEKIPGKQNVADCLTKHLSPEDTKAHIERCGWKKLQEPYRIAELVRVNSIKEVVNSDKLVIENEANKRRAEVEYGLKLAKQELGQSESNFAERAFGQVRQQDESTAAGRASGSS